MPAEGGLIVNRDARCVNVDASAGVDKRCRCAHGGQWPHACAPPPCTVSGPLWGMGEVPCSGERHVVTGS